MAEVCHDKAEAMRGCLDGMVVVALDHLDSHDFEAHGEAGQYRAGRFGRDAIPGWARRMHVAPDAFRAITEVFKLDAEAESHA